MILKLKKIFMLGWGMGKKKKKVTQKSLNDKLIIIKAFGQIFIGG